MANTKPAPEDEEPADAATEELVAYLDGELDSKAADSVANRLSRDQKLRTEADALQRAWDILDILPRPQPSATFTARTLSMAIPTAAATPYGQTMVLTGPGMSATSSPGGGLSFWLATLMLIAAAGAVGYLAHRELSPTRTPNLDPSLEDVPMMKNMRLYRHVDDMDFLHRLDSPDLFAVEE